MKPLQVIHAGVTLLLLVAVLGFSISAGRKAGLRSVAALALVFPVVHVSYGLGFLRCVVALALRSGRPARHAELPLSR